jgi:glyoxylase-like metal-dependent hydrolase (beta-lactamase superfamily II)
MKIERIIGGNLEANGYVIHNGMGKEGWIIDPGYSAGRYRRLTTDLKLLIRGILLTHHHYDHVGAVAVLRNDLNCPVYLHREDLPWYKEVYDTVLEGGEVFLLGDEEIKVLHTPGHTAGGVCYYLERSRVAFTGDTVFNVDLGRTDLPGGSEAQMRRSLIEVVNRWANDVTIYPGHGDPCTMKYVREVNGEFLEMVDGK